MSVDSDTIAAWLDRLTTVMENSTGTGLEEGSMADVGGPETVGDGSVGAHAINPTAIAPNPIAMLASSRRSMVRAMPVGE